MNRREAFLETAQPLSHGLPCGDISIRANNERERTLNGGESTDHLHQSTEPDLLRKIARRNHDDRENERNLSVAGSKPSQTLLSLHYLPEIFENAEKALLEDAELHGFTTIEGNALGIL